MELSSDSPQTEINVLYCHRKDARKAKDAGKMAERTGASRKKAFEGSRKNNG